MPVSVVHHDPPSRQQPRRTWSPFRHRALTVLKSREEAMRAADDFAAIRARMEQLQRERIAPRRDDELRGHDEELERKMDWRPAQRETGETKARNMARNRLSQARRG